MLRLLILLILVTSMVACNHKMFAQSSMRSTGDSSMTITTTGINIRKVDLIAREERSLPPGTRPSRDRAIGFASVFIELENTTSHWVPVTIERIQVRNLFGVQLATETPQTLNLQPLEIHAHHEQLTNKTGFVGFGPVRATVTLKVNGETQVVESNAIAVQRY